MQCFPNRLFRVLRGSGQGLGHSGDIADIALANIVEIPWACLPEIQHKYRIKLFRRYRDDMLIIGENKDLAVEFVEEYKGRSKYFLVDIEEAAESELRVLDLNIIKTKGSYLVGVGFKSNFHSTAPLEPSSGHVPSVHISWPKARIRDIHKLSSNEELAMEAIKKFLSRFKSHYIDTKHLQ